MIRSPTVFYGWIVACALAVLTSAQVGASFSFGLYLRPMSEQYGVDRAALALAVTLNAVLVGVMQPVAGYLADRYGPRRIAVTGALVLGLAVLLLSMAQGLAEIYLYYGVLGGVGMAMATRGVTARIVGAWFQRRRAIAMALSGGGALIAQLGIVPVAAIVLGRSDWQTADRVVAAIILGLIVPITWAFVRNTPRERGTWADGFTPLPPDDLLQREPSRSPSETRKGASGAGWSWRLADHRVSRERLMAPDDAQDSPSPSPMAREGSPWRRGSGGRRGGEATSSPDGEDGLSMREAIRRASFWQLSFGLITCGVTMSFPYTHLMAYATDMGMSDMTASETIGLAGLLSLPGALLLAYAGDRFGRHRMLAIAYALRSITYLILLRADQPAIMLAAGITLGLSWGATVSLTAAIVPDLFGHRMIATIVTFMTMLMSVASGTYTYLAGLDFDLLGNYQIALGFAAVLGAISFVCCWSIRMPEAPSHRRLGAVAAG